jgi:hypothetical protein
MSSRPVRGEKPPGAVRLSSTACTVAKAQRFVAAVHRHHGPVPGGYAYWSIAALAGRSVVGVAIVGRPTNRNSDDGETVEVLRIAALDVPNVCSFLLGACARTAKASGCASIITYTLETESGDSPKAAGWDREADGIISWWQHSSGAENGRIVKPRAHYDVRKVRWARRFRPAGESPIEWPVAPPPMNALPLFSV